MKIWAKNLVRIYHLADLAHLMIGTSIISARINVNFGQNDWRSDHQIHPYMLGDNSVNIKTETKLISNLLIKPEIEPIGNSNY